MRTDEGILETQNQYRRPPQMSFSELLRRLLHDVETLLKSEIHLAKVELQQNLKKAVRGVVLIAIAAGVALLGAFALVAAASAAAAGLLVEFMPMEWAVATGALSVGVLMLLAALIICQIGRRRLRKTSLTPETTIRTWKEDVKWIQSKMS